MALTDKLSAIGDAIRAKTGKPEKLTLEQMPLEIAEISGGGGAVLGELTVTENGTYNAAYEAASFTWDENTEYDFTVEAEGIPLRVKKLTGFSVPDDVKYLNSPEYAITAVMPDVGDEVIPLNEIGIADFYGAGYMSDSLMYTVVWVKTAALFNETVGDTVFEDNSVYVTDFLWVVSDGTLAGATLALTAPGKKLDGISSVTVDVEAEPNLQEKWVYENGEVYPDDGFDGLSCVNVRVEVPYGTLAITENGTYDVYQREYVDVNVPIPDGYVKPSGTKAITENGTHDVSGYAQAEVDIPDPVLQEKTVTENGEVLPDDGYDGLSKVTVAVESSGGGLAINGVVKQYKVDDGASVQAGDFVALVSKYGSGEFASSVEYVASCSISAEKKVVLYTDKTVGATMAQVVSVQDGIVFGTPLQVFASTAKYINIVALNPTTFVAVNDKTIQAFTIDGDTLTLGATRTASYSCYDIISLNENLFAYVLGWTDSSYKQSNTRVYLCKLEENAITTVQYQTIQLQTGNYYGFPDGGTSLAKLSDTHLIASAIASSGNNQYTLVIRIYAYSDTSLEVVSSYSMALTTYSGTTCGKHRLCKLTEDTAMFIGCGGRTDGQGHIYHLAKNGATIDCISYVLTGLVTNGIIGISENKALLAHSGNCFSIVTVDKEASKISKGSNTVATMSVDYGKIGLEPISENNILAFVNSGTGRFLNINTDNDTITIAEDTDTERGTFVKPATSYFNNVGVAATGGAEGETVDVYVVG